MVDTIFAQASARGQAGVAVVRISGALALTAAAALAGGAVPARRAVLRWLRDPDSGERIDQAVVLAFPAPGSFTGEDVAELQVHGSQAVVRALLAVLGRMPGLRSAEPGEFTRRALINERLSVDSDTIVKSLRGLGIQVDQLTVQPPQVTATGAARPEGTSAQTFSGGQQQSAQTGNMGGGERNGRSQCVIALVKLSVAERGGNPPSVHVLAKRKALFLDYPISFLYSCRDRSSVSC